MQPLQGRSDYLTDICRYRFNPKEDVSSSTSLKSSVQRHIRTSLLTQFPLLSQPAHKETHTQIPSSEGLGPGDEKAEEKEGKEGENELKEDTSKGKKKVKGGKGKGKGKDKDEKEDEVTGAGGGDQDAEMTVLDEIWPKKEALGLTKWYV